MLILLDSGAYSAWTKRVAIDLRSYIEFIKKHRRIVSSYVSLDVIPGQDGRRPDDREQINAAARASYRNLQIMKDAGLTPIPVFHQDEDFDWLELMVDAGETFIGLSPFRRRSPSQKMHWLDRCFDIIGPNIRVHAFGVTDPVLVLRYPFFSCDSTTWMLRAGYGQIPVPRHVHDLPDFTVKPEFMSVTDQYSTRNHIDRKCSAQHERISTYLRNVGTEVAQVQSVARARWHAWAMYLIGLQAACTDPRSSYLWHPFKKLERNRHTKIVFASQLDRMQCEVLDACGVEHRLFSFHKIQQSRYTLDDYVRRDFGTVTPRRSKAASVVLRNE